MRLRNIWFDALSFLVAAMMAGYAVFSVVDYWHDDNASFFSTALTVGLFLFAAIVYFWISFRVGDVHRRARSRRRDSRNLF